MCETNDREITSPDTGLGRRELLAYTAAFGTTFLAGQGLVRKSQAADAEPSTTVRTRAPKRYDMKSMLVLSPVQPLPLRLRFLNR